MTNRFTMHTCGCSTKPTLDENGDWVAYQEHSAEIERYHSIADAASKVVEMLDCDTEWVSPAARLAWRKLVDSVKASKESVVTVL